MIGSVDELDQGLLTVVEAARVLHVGRTTVYGLMERGQLQFVRIGRARRIPKAAIRDFIKRNLKGAWKL
jgi:excisionase family DNA binding protein